MRVCACVFLCLCMLLVHIYIYIYICVCVCVCMYETISRVIKGESKWRCITDLTTRNGVNNSHGSVFHSILGPLCWKSTVESCENMTVSAAILCPTACVSDVMNKASVLARVLNILWANLFLLFLSKEWSNMAAPWGAQIQSMTELETLVLFKHWKKN